MTFRLITHHFYTWKCRREGRSIYFALTTNYDLRPKDRFNGLEGSAAWQRKRVREREKQTDREREKKKERENKESKAKKDKI